MAVFPSDLRSGTDVYSSDGHKLGELHRVILKRADLTISHVVVDIGFLRSGRSIWQGGFGLDYDRVVPVDQVFGATTERIDLAVSAEAFKDAPQYTAEFYEEPHDLTPNQFDLPDVVTNLQNLAAIFNSTSALWIHEKLNKSDDSVDITEGSDVWRTEPHEKLGDIKSLIFDEASGALQALVIARGLFFKHEVILPARYITELYEGIVRVNMSDAELSGLQEHAGD